jgi:hypothetical protein
LGDGWLREGDGWLSREIVAKQWRWVAKLAARLLATAALWDRIQTSLKKYKMCEISKEVANTL